MKAFRISPTISILDTWKSESFLRSALSVHLSRKTAREWNKLPAHVTARSRDEFSFLVSQSSVSST